MAWGLFLFASVVAQAIASIANRFVMRSANKHTWAYAALSQIITGSLIGLYAFFISGFVMPPLVELWPWFLMTVLLNVGANIFQNEALRTAEASSFTIFSSGRILVSILAALLVLGEHVTLIQALGAVIMIAAISIAFGHRLEFKWEPWMGPALLYALSSGIVFIGDARIVSESVDVASYMAFAFFVPGVVTMIFKPKVVPDVIRLASSKEFIPMVFFSVSYGFMAITLWLAYQYGGAASQTAPIRQSAVILTVLLGIIFLNERTRLARKFTAAALAIVAVYLIAMK